MKPSAMMLLLAGGLLVAGPLLAQDAQPVPVPRADDLMGTAAMMGMQGSPQMILRLRKPLELTQQQMERLQGIHRDMQYMQGPHLRAAAEALRDAEALLHADPPDWNGYKAQLREAADHQVEAHLTVAQAMIDARNVLTAEQQAQFDLARAATMELMHEEMRAMTERVRREAVRPTQRVDQR